MASQNKRRSPGKNRPNPLAAALAQRLKGARRVAVLGIGSDMRADDGAGVLAARRLLKQPKGSILKAFDGATAPENLTGEIKSYRPTHIIIIDTVEFKERPGTILFLSAEDIGGGVSFSTHNLPAKILVNYFLKSFDCRVIVIGIQPKTVEFGKPITAPVKSAVGEVAAAIARAVKGLDIRRKSV